MSVTVFSPASIGNFGVGFDLLGLALKTDSLDYFGDRVEICASEGFLFRLRGSCADVLKDLPLEDNLVYKSLLLFESRLKAQFEIDFSWNISITLEKNLPVGSGLGSSACSIVATIEALNLFYDGVFSQSELIDMMSILESGISGAFHYDNVVPSYLGGFKFIPKKDVFHCIDIPFFSSLYMVVAFPGVSLGTKEARNILPKDYPLATLIESSSHLTAFVSACYEQDLSLALDSLIDVVAEPYRRDLILNFNMVESFAKAHDFVFGISGAGPTIFMLALSFEAASLQKQWLSDNFLLNENGFCLICQMDSVGTCVTESL